MSPVSEEDAWLSLARGGLGQMSHEIGRDRWKGQNRKNVYLSPYVETFKLKGNKKFRTWTEKS